MDVKAAFAQHGIDAELITADRVAHEFWMITCRGFDLGSYVPKTKSVRARTLSRAETVEDAIVLFLEKKAAIEARELATYQREHR